MKTTSLAFASLALGVALLASSGCASSRRMMEVSVFGEGNERLSDDRVNLFPLYYANGDKHSVLWPIGDWDDHGFAVRPLYNQQDHDYSVLFPLSSWNPQQGEGWVLTAWWNRGAFGVFPLGGAGPDWWFAGPLIRANTHSENPGTLLFPVAYWDRDSFWMLNAWWGKQSQGFFPLFEKGRDWWAAGPFVHANDFNLLLPVAYWDHDSLWLAELFYGQNMDEKGYAKWRSLFGLMAFGERTAHGHEWWALPLLTYHDRQGEELTHVTFPVWWQFDDAKTHSRTLFPLFHQETHADDNFSCLITPLGGYGSTPTGDKHLLNVFGPLYWDYRAPHERITNVAGLYYRINDAHYALFGLGKAQVNDQGTSWRAWPLACGESGPGMAGQDEGFLQTTALFWHGTNGKCSSWHYWPLLSWGETAPTHQESDYLLGLLGDTHDTNQDTGLSHDVGRRLFYRTEKMRPLPGGRNWDWVAQPQGALRASDTVETLLTHQNNTTRSGLPGHARPADGAWIGLGHWLNCPQGPAWGNLNAVPWLWRSSTTDYGFHPKIAKDAIPYPGAREVRATLETLGVKNLPPSAELSATGTSAKDRARLEQALTDTAVTWNTSERRFDPLLIPLWERTQEREHNGQATKDQALWGLLWDYQRKPGEASFRLLWRMYERQQEGEGANATVKRNIFPFVRWDSSPEKSRVSFLWRVVDWRTSKTGKAGGHFLFIPWGQLD